MKCHVCGCEMTRIFTNLPFKISNSAIVILKNLPTYQCGGCSEYLLEDSVAARIEEIFDTVNAEAELEILEYAA
ncbi:MAG: YgiT-type zinc finger domain-containing protein [Desulfobacteraceae bacterium IS3]|nr:MAG: YgiT-type zinc finger domain-containing protein [Desulfobacteraceae bacterium IS3]